MSLKNAIVLLVEDNPADQNLTVRAFRKGKIDVDLRIVDDGIEAIEYLSNKGKYTDKKAFPFPDLILLDINMPRMDGIQTLKEIRSTLNIKTIPIIMLTTSDQERDIHETFQSGVNAYINKPVNINQFIEAIQTLEEFWFQLSLLPKNYYNQAN